MNGLKVRGSAPRHLLAGALMLGGLLAPLAASAQVITNGSFEVNGGLGSSTFTGWSVFQQGSGNWYVDNGITSPTSGYPVPAPSDSNFAAMTDQGSPGSYALRQTITVPPVGGTLLFDLFLGNRHSAYITAAPPNLSTSVNNQQMRADVMNPAAGPLDVGAGVLANIYQTDPGDPLVSGYSTISFDMTPFAGQTVTIRFASAVQQFFFQTGIDNVRFVPPAFSCATLVPVVGQWGITGGRCGNFVSTATAATYESALFNGPPPVGGGYSYEVRFVSNRPRQPTAATTIIVAGSPFPLRQSSQWWDQGVFFNVANGKYSIFRYNGVAKPVPLQNWVVPVGVTFAAPPASNRLSVETQAGNLVFSINGTVVRTLPNVYGVNQFGMGFVRSVSTTGNLVTDDWMEILGVTLNGAPPENPRAPATVSPAQQQANDAANASRVYQDPMFAPKLTN